MMSRTSIAAPNRKGAKQNQIAGQPPKPGNQAQAVLIFGIFKRILRHYEAREYAQAESLCLKILSLDVRHADALYMLGMVGYKTGRLEMAERMIRRAIGINGNQPYFHSNLGNALKDQNRLDEAVASYERALQIQPRFYEACFNLANTLVQQKKLDRAEEFFKKSLEYNPQYADALCNLGAMYRTQKRVEEALECFARALEISPKNPDLMCSYADTLHVMGRVDEAILHFEKTLQLKPDHAKACNCLGNAHFDRGEIDKSVYYCHRALEFKSEFPDAMMNVCLLQLLQGDYVNGWRNYEVRWKAYQPRVVPRPLWLGAPLNGARILLHHEQGLGDSLQFLRYVPMVIAAGGQVVLDLPKALYRLAAQIPGLAALVVTGDPVPNVHCHAPLMTLPLAFGTTLETIPNRVPYLSVPPEAAEAAAKIAHPENKLRVGLVWAGNPSHPKDKARSIPLSLFEPLYTVEGVQFYSLQLGPAAAELPQAQGKIIDLTAGIEDMADTAAYMAQMDLIISVDTSPVHLAGALAKPTWALIPFAPDWRWMLDREDCLWYPTMRLFRRPTRGEWQPTMQRMRAALAELVEQKRAVPESNPLQPAQPSM